MTNHKEYLAKNINQSLVEENQLHFFEKYLGDPPKSILDIASGDGGHAIHLAQKGYLITALDSNAAMIDQAKEKAELDGVEIATLECKMDQMTEHISGKFDAALCIGNAMVHLDCEDRIIKFLKDLNHILIDGGKAILQIVNYDCDRAQSEIVVLKQNKIHSLMQETNFKIIEEYGDFNGTPFKKDESNLYIIILEK